MDETTRAEERKKEKKGKTLRRTPLLALECFVKNPALETPRIGSLISHHTLRVMVK